MGRLFSNGHRYDNFEPEEFHCPCCGMEKMAHRTMEKAEAVRYEYDDIIHIAEGGGWRCPAYNFAIGGAKLTAHLEGKGIDPLYPVDDHFILLKLAFKHGFTGIGDKQNGGEFQQHWDDAEEIHGLRPRPWKWTYNS